MLKTTSIFNYYSLSSTSSVQPLTIRVPKNLKVFRAHIICDSREDVQQPTEVTICTDYPAANSGSGQSLSGIFLTNFVYNEMAVPVAPDTATGKNVTNTNFVILDRRGVGYMTDDFYVFGKGGISVIWEGITES